MPTVSYEASNGDIKEFQIAEGEILFEALENAGEILPHGCLAGSCSACKIEIISGSESLPTPSAIESDTISSVKKKDSAKDKDIRLACRLKIFKDIHFKSFN